jgi:hypothetical protein
LQARNVVEELHIVGIVAGKQALDQRGSAVTVRALPAVFNFAIELAFACLSVKPVVHRDELVTDFVEQLQFLDSKFFH